MKELRGLLNTPTSSIVSRVRALLGPPRDPIVTDANEACYQERAELESWNLKDKIEGDFEPSPPGVGTPAQTSVNEGPGNKGVQVNFRQKSKRDIDIILKIKAYEQMCYLAATNIPPITNFWRFYDIQQTQCAYLIQNFYHINILDTILELAEFEEIWDEAQTFRPILATMLAHGDLQFVNSDLFCAYFGNLPFFTFQFMNLYSKQVKKEVYPHPRFWPKKPNVYIKLWASTSKRHKIWWKQSKLKKDVFEAQTREFSFDNTLYRIHNVFSDAAAFERI